MKRNILVLCTGNSCRSQIAEGYLRHLADDIFDVTSAGLEPSVVNPKAIQVMAEDRIDISSHSSKNVDLFTGQEFDYIITVCDNARESCPLFPRPVKKIHKSFDDPPFLAESAKSEMEALDIYRRVRDEIRAFVETLLATLKE